jgi:hypothetical protein
VPGHFQHLGISCIGYNYKLLAHQHSRSEHRRRDHNQWTGIWMVDFNPAASIGRYCLHGPLVFATA